MVRVPRRSTKTLSRGARIFVVAGLALTVATPTVAGGYTITQIKNKINRLSTQLAEQVARSGALSQRYDAVASSLITLDAQIHRLQHQEKVTRHKIKVTDQKLVAGLVRAYVNQTASAQTITLLDQNVTQSDARQVYLNQAIGNLRQYEVTLTQQHHQLEHVLSQESHQRSVLAANKRELNYLIGQNYANEQATQHTLSQVSHALAGQIVAFEMSAALSAARHHDTKGVEDAVAAASQVGGQDAANRILAAVAAITVTAVTGTPAGSRQGLAAVAAAKSQLGVPYVWGGETPGQGFDCSGLTQWSWSRAGFQIPRTSAEQYGALRHVQLNQLRPGDILFYFNLDNDHMVDHDVMYVGSGPYGSQTVIAAAHTGTLISFEPLFTYGLVGAGRP